jgi:hypothetical protein
MVAEANNRRDDTRYAVDIRVFVTVIVIAMAVSFGVGVGLGPTPTSPVAPVPAVTPLPPVTSVQVAEAGEFPIDEVLHEPAGQVSEMDVKFTLEVLLLHYSSVVWQKIGFTVALRQNGCFQS